MIGSAAIPCFSYWFITLKVLIEENGNPMGTRIHAPIPNCIRPYLKMISHPKKADYTKLFAIATKFV